MIILPLLAALFLNQPADDATFAWKVPTEGFSTCGCDRHNINFKRDWHETTEIVLIARLRAGSIRKLEIADAACPLKDARLLEGITPEASLQALLEQMNDSNAERDEIVTAIAMHALPRVVPELLSLARHHPDTDIRRSATFWLGQKAGEKAAAELRAIVDDDPEDEVREHAVFAISQLPRERAVPMLIDLVRHHPRPNVRQRAMFWLTQTGDPRALDLIAEILHVQ